jgi:hypothetical protein
MIKKSRQSTVADRDSIVTPSSSLLDNHFHEIVETAEEVVGLVAILKSLSSAEILSYPFRPPIDRIDMDRP